MLLEGSLSASVLFVSDFCRISCAAEGRVLGDELARPLRSAMQQAGLREADCAFTVLHPRTPRDGHSIHKLEGRDGELTEFKALLSVHAASVIVPLGEYAFSQLTGLHGLQKYHCTLVKAKAEFGGRKVVPLYHPEHIQKSYGDSFYLALGCFRIKREASSAAVTEQPRRFQLGPSFDETMRYLREVVEPAAEIAIDLEFGQGMINVVGIAVSPHEAIAIRALPEHYSAEQHFELWQAIARIMESDKPKIAQHFITESTWLARYGIHVRNIIHDTMWAMKFLHPELDKGLDNVGRVYTDFPYWKSDNDDWANIRDWPRHYDYNCKDTTGTFEAYLRQKKALADRKLDKLFYSFIMRFAPVIHEMCVTGLRVDPPALITLKEKLDREQASFMRVLDQQFLERIGRTINPRSHQQLRLAMKELGIAIPTKHSKKKGSQVETTDKKALVKLRKKYPKEEVLPALIGLSATNKQLSSYVDFEYDRKESRVHYTLDGCGTETGRWAGYNSGWGEGFNPQTVPKTVRNCFIADPGRVLVQIDLAQAESRYVAWEAPEPTLIQLIQDRRDVHAYVAGRIFKKPEQIVSKSERQLGKKSGHAANYGVGPQTFAEACLVEMNLHIEQHEAKRIIETYFEVFPGIRRRQENIRRELQQKRVLRTPIGRERHFYGRMNDASFREAYAYAPQSVIPDITNCLMLRLWELKDALDLQFLLQVHDSLLLQAPPERVEEIAAVARDYACWHPKVELAGGLLVIPVDIEVGERWGKVQKL